MNEIEYIVRETSYPSAIKQEVIGVIVRCKDCRYLKTGENEIESWSICTRVIVYPYLDVGPNDYCSYGERRTDD